MPSKSKSSSRETKKKLSGSWKGRSSGNATTAHFEMRMNVLLPRETTPAAPAPSSPGRRSAGRMRGRFVVGAEFFEPMSADDIREFYGE